MKNQSNDIFQRPSVDPEDAKRLVSQMIAALEVAGLVFFSIFLGITTFIFFAGAYIIAETNPQIPSRIWVICGAIWSLGILFGYSISLRAILQKLIGRNT